MSELNEADEARLVDDMSDAMRMHDGETSTWMSHARKVIHDLTAKGYVIIPPPEPDPVYVWRLPSYGREAVLKALAEHGDKDWWDDLYTLTPEER